MTDGGDGESCARAEMLSMGYGMDFMPGVIAGALMAFTLSIDDFVITFFTAGAGTVTLPLQIYSMIKIAVTPEVNAVSTLLMLLTLLLIVIASKVSPSLLRAS